MQPQPRLGCSQSITETDPDPPERPEVLELHLWVEGPEQGLKAGLGGGGEREQVEGGGENRSDHRNQDIQTSFSILLLYLHSIYSLELFFLLLSKNTELCQPPAAWTQLWHLKPLGIKLVKIASSSRRYIWRLSLLKTACVCVCVSTDMKRCNWPSVWVLVLPIRTDVYQQDCFSWICPISGLKMISGVSVVTVWGCG